MVTLISNYVLILTTIIILISFQSKKLKNILISCIFILITILLTILIINNVKTDLSLLNVIEHSNSMQPILYKICGSWGNHEGSFLLWCWLLSGYNLSIQLLLKKTIKTVKLKILNIQNILLLFFFIYLLLTSNPFLSTILQNFDGLPLNPILQDIGLSIHPPSLYLGYVGFSVIFTFGLILAKFEDLNIENNKNLKYYKYENIVSVKKNILIILHYYLKQWLLFGWTFLTFGIALGSWWSYYELGWGGWWFWDPVENASLLPWLIGTALLHTLLIDSKLDQKTNWVIGLSILSFILTVIGLFLVRSGFLDSVHSFANDNNRGYWLLALLIVIVLGSISIYLKFYLKQNNYIIKNHNKTLKKIEALLLNNIFLLVFCLTILLITVLPLFFRVFTLQERSFGAPFFNNLLIPVLIPFFILMSISPFLKQNLGETKSLVKESLKPVISFSIITCLVVVFVAYFKNQINFTITFGIFLLLSLFLLISLTYLYIFKYFLKLNINFKNKNHLSMYIAHIGVSLLILGATCSSYLATDIIQMMTPGDCIVIDNLICIFRNLNQIENLNYHSIYGDFLIKELETNITTGQDIKSIMFPERRYHYINEIFTTKSSIFTNNFFDILVILGEGSYSKGWFVQVSIKPFLSFLWYGAFLLVVSGFISLYTTIKYLKTIR